MLDRALAELKEMLAALGLDPEEELSSTDGSNTDRVADEAENGT